MRRVLLSFLLLCLSSVPAAALDYEDEYPGPFLHGSIPLEIEKISISVSEKTVQYSYTIVNPTERIVQLPLTFAVAPYKWTGTHQETYKNGYRNLTVAIDGNDVALTKTVQASINGNDIAPLLLGLGIDPVFEGVIAFSKKHEGIIASNPKLAERGYLVKICEDDCDDPANHYYVPQWTVAANYSFSHEIKPNSRAVLLYEYEPIWGHAIGTLGSPAAWEVNKIGCVFSDVFKTLESTLDDPFFTKWLTVPVSSLGAKKLPENVSVTVNIAAEGPQFIHAVLGDHRASGKSMVPISITNEPVGGPLKILLLQKILSRKAK